MKSIFLTSAALLVSVGIAAAQTSGASGTGTSSGMANGSNSGSTSGSMSNGSSQGTGSNGSSTSGSTSNGSASTGQMTLSQISHKLAPQGYVHVKDLRKHNGYYTVNAHRYGNDQHNLRINAQTGQVENQGKLSTAQVKNMLHLHHYTDVDHVHHNGDMISATAKKNGHKTNLSINAKTGMMQPQ